MPLSRNDFDGITYQNMNHLTNGPSRGAQYNNIVCGTYMFLPYAEYDDKTMMYAEALLIEYHKGEVLFDAL